MVAMPRGTGSYAIHIIMERATAKSNDCYIEFETLDAAGAESARLQSARRLVGIRRARIHLSSQEELMTELFPKAQCVQWHGCQPVVQENRDAVLRGFKGFVTGEEMHATARIAENPSRVSLPLPHRSSCRLLTVFLPVLLTTFSISTNSRTSTRSAPTNL